MLLFKSSLNINITINEITKGVASGRYLPIGYGNSPPVLLNKTDTLDMVCSVNMYIQNEQIVPMFVCLYNYKYEKITISFYLNTKFGNITAC